MLSHIIFSAYQVLIYFIFTHMCFENVESYISNVCCVEFFALQINMVEKHLYEKKARCHYDYTGFSVTCDIEDLYFL
jgi:hypothetical protein